MRAVVSRVLLAILLGVIAAIVIVTCSGCRRVQAQSRPPAQHGLPMKEGEIIWVPQDPCDWQDVPYWVRVVIGCNTSGGSSGAS